MRRLLIVLLAPVALTLMLVPPVVRASLVGPVARASSPQRVTICGTSFCVNRSPFYPYGASFYSSTSRSGILSNPAGAVALARELHLNTLRAVNWLSHDAVVSAATSDSTWRPLDRFVGDAQNAGLRVWLDLSDFKIVLMKHCLNPFTDLNGWYKLVDYAAHRVNTVTGATYGTDPELAWVGFYGEPREANRYYSRLGSGNFSGTDPANATPEPNWGAPGAECPANLYYSTSDVTRYYSSVESRWKGEATLPTMAGGLTKLDEIHSGNIDWKSIFSNPSNDICGFKTYGGMEAWLPKGTSYCSRTLHKPSVNVEWGYRQSLGDSARASAFSRQFANNKHAGIAGTFYWNAGYKSGGYDVGSTTISPLTFQQVLANAPS